MVIRTMRHFEYRFAKYSPTAGESSYRDSGYWSARHWMSFELELPWVLVVVDLA